MGKRSILFFKQARVIVLLSFGAILIQACATQPPPATGSGVPGFPLGLLHGISMPLGLIVSIFTDYRIYAFPNSGFGYDLGYLIGAMLFLGGGGAGASKGSR